MRAGGTSQRCWRCKALTLSERNCCHGCNAAIKRENKALYRYIGAVAGDYIVERLKSARPSPGACG